MKTIPLPDNSDNYREVARIGYLEKEGEEEGGKIQVILSAAEDDPHVWGILMADLARNVAQMLEQAHGQYPNKVIKQLRDLFDKEMDNPTSFPDGDLRLGKFEGDEDE